MKKFRVNYAGELDSERLLEACSFEEAAKVFLLQSPADKTIFVSRGILGERTFRISDLVREYPNLEFELEEIANRESDDYDQLFTSHRVQTIGEDNFRYRQFARNMIIKLVITIIMIIGFAIYQFSE